MSETIRYRGEVGAARKRIYTRRLVPHYGTASNQTIQFDCASLQGGDAMAKSTMDFAQQNTERAVQATNWVRAIAEQNLNQSKAAFEGLLTIARNAVPSVHRQSSAICEHSIAAAEQTLSNAFDFAHKVQELVQIQSDFVSRQAQVLGEQTKELGQRMMEGVQEIEKATEARMAESRRRSEAA